MTEQARAELRGRGDAWRVGGADGCAVAGSFGTRVEAEQAAIRMNCEAADVKDAAIGGWEEDVLEADSILGITGEDVLAARRGGRQQTR